MKLNILAIFSLIIISAFIGACSGTPANNAGNANGNTQKVNTASPVNAVAVTTPTPAQTTNDAPTLSPVYKALCDALIKKDEAAVRKVYSADTLANFAQQMKDKVIVAELNIDQNPFIKEKYQIQRYPTVLIFDRGIEVKRLVGAQSKSDLIDALEAAVFANVGMAGEEKY